MTTVPTHSLNDGTTIPAIGFGTYPLTGEDGIRAMVSAAGGRLPAARHGRQLRQRDRGGRGDPPVRRRPGRARRPDARCPAGTTRTTRPSPRSRARSSDLVSSRSTSRSSTGPTPASGCYVEAYRALVECRERGLVRVRRRQQLHRAAPGRRHRGDRGRAGAQPGRAAPALPAGAAAGRPRAARDRHRGVEPARQAQRPLRRRPGGRGRRGARRHARPRRSCAGRSSSASCRCRSRRTPSGSAPTSTSSVSSSSRRRDGRDLGARARGRPALRRRPRHPRGDVSR